MKSNPLFIVITLFLVAVYKLVIAIPLDGRAMLKAPSNKDKNNKNHEIDNNLILSSKSLSDEDFDFNETFSPLQVLCEVNGFAIPAIIDTGAQITIMSASCAKRCRISNLIDSRFAGRAIGVGSSDILGRINDLRLRIGPINFQSRISVLSDSSVDFLIGMDFLRRFKCDLCLTEGIMKLRVREKYIRIPLLSDKSLFCNNYDDVEVNGQNEDSEDDYEDSFDTNDESSETEEEENYMNNDKNKRNKHVSIYSMKSNDDDFDDDVENDSSFYRKMSMEGV